MPYPSHLVRYPVAWITPTGSRRSGGNSARRAWWDITHPCGCLFVLAVALLPIAGWLILAGAVTAGWVLWTTAVTLWWLVTLPLQRGR